MLISFRILFSNSHQYINVLTSPFDFPTSMFSFYLIFPKQIEVAYEDHFPIGWGNYIKRRRRIGWKVFLVFLFVRKDIHSVETNKGYYSLNQTLYALFLQFIFLLLRLLHLHIILHYPYIFVIPLKSLFCVVTIFFNIRNESKRRKMWKT